MRGHLRSQTKGSWQIIVDVGRDATGRRIQHRETVRGTRREAEKRLAQILHEQDTGVFVRPGKLTVAEFSERWLRDYAKPKIAPRSYDRYADILKMYVLPAIGNLPLTSLKPVQIQELYSAWLTRGLSNRTVRYHHAVIHKSLESALKWGLVGRNIADSVEVPKAGRKEMTTWSEGELSRFLEVTKDSPYFSLFYLAAFTGARRSELLGLTWGAVDLPLAQISISRGLHQLKDNTFVFSQCKSAKSQRTIALSPSTVLVLKAHHDKQAMDGALMGQRLADSDLVFSTLDGKPLRPNTVSRAWTTLVARSGLKTIRLHDLRHTHASLLLKQGVHPKIASERLGHSTIAMTLDLYSHVAPGLQEAAANRFDDIIKSPAKI